MAGQHHHADPYADDTQQRQREPAATWRTPATVWWACTAAGTTVGTILLDALRDIPVWLTVGGLLAGFACTVIAGMVNTRQQMQDQARGLEMERQRFAQRALGGLEERLTERIAETAAELRQQMARDRQLLLEALTSGPIAGQMTTIMRLLQQLAAQHPDVPIAELMREVQRTHTTLLALPGWFQQTVEAECTNTLVAAGDEIGRQSASDTVVIQLSPQQRRMLRPLNGYPSTAS